MAAHLETETKGPVHLPLAPNMPAEIELHKVEVYPCQCVQNNP